MPPSRIDWSTVTDINERRKLQNRQAQKNYRTRQKLRIQLAEAVLHDTPSLDVFFSGIKSRGKNNVSHTGAQVYDSDTSVLPSSSTGAPISGAGRRPSSATHLDQLMFASGASRSLEADGSKSECRESSQQDVFFEAGTGTLSPDNAMASINYLDTLQLDQNDWIGIGYDSPPNALQSPAVSPTMANDAFNDSAVISTSPPSQSVLPNARLTRSQTLRLASSRGENNRDAEADNVLEPFSGSPSSLSSLRYQPSTRCSFASSSSTLKDKTSLSASRKTLTQGTAAELTACDSRAGGGGGGEWSHKNPLLTAVMLGNLEVARLLLGSSAKLDDPDHSGNTNLHHAVQRGEVSMASALLELGADVTTTNSDSKGLLHTAVQNNDLEMVRMLLEWCDAHSQRKEQPSASASKREEKQGNEGGNSTLIQRCINARDGGGRTAVHLSVLLNRVEIMRVLLDYGANVNIGCD